MCGVVAAVRRWIRVHVVGRHPGPHEDELVAEIFPLQQLGADRIEEGLGALGLAVVGKQGHVLLLDGLPQGIALRVRQRSQVEFALDARDRFEHTLVVEVDALAGTRAHRLKVAVFVKRLGLLGDVAEQAIVPIEALEDRIGDPRRRWHRTVEHDLGDSRHGRYCDETDETDEASEND